MARYSFKEKLRYNKARQKNNPFASGYVFGVALYEDFPRQNNEFKKTVKEFIDTMKSSASGKDSDYEKGVMCGYRDAANERKAKAKDITRERKQARARDKFFVY